MNQTTSTTVGIQPSNLFRCNRLSALRIDFLLLFPSLLPRSSPVLPPFSFSLGVFAFSPYPPATPCSHRGESETQRSSYSTTPCGVRRRTVDTHTVYRAPCEEQSMVSEPATTTLPLLPRLEGRCWSLPSPRGTDHPLQNHQSDASCRTRSPPYCHCRLYCCECC